MRKNTTQRALDIQDVVAKHYIPGRHDRCKRWVFKTYIAPLYHISEPTFFRYLRVPAGEEPEKEAIRQLDLFS